MNPKDLLKLKVQTWPSDEYDNEHGCVEISAQDGTMFESTEFTDAQVIAAAVQLTGILGRVAAHAAPFIEAERQRHGCRSTIQKDLEHPEDLRAWGGCHISVRVLDALEEPGSMFVSISVPEGRVKAWEQLVRKLLRRASVTSFKTKAA